MTYIVSSGTLNPTIPYFATAELLVTPVSAVPITMVIPRCDEYPYILHVSSGARNCDAAL